MFVYRFIVGCCAYEAGALVKTKIYFVNLLQDLEH